MADVLSPPSPRPGSLAIPRLAGAAVAAVISVPEAVAASSLWHVDALWAGVASVVVLGGWLGPRTVRRPAFAMLAKATLSIPLSSLLVSAWMVSANASTIDAPLAVPLWSLIGDAIFGVPALLVTLPSALAWLHGARWLVRRCAGGTGAATSWTGEPLAGGAAPPAASRTRT
jgi:hypothetical protein